MKKNIQRANTLIEAIPYIKKFNSKTIVFKYGGSIGSEDFSDWLDKPNPLRTFDSKNSGGPEFYGLFYNL